MLPDVGASGEDQRSADTIIQPELDAREHNAKFFFIHRVTVGIGQRGGKWKGRQERFYGEGGGMWYGVAATTPQVFRRLPGLQPVRSAPWRM